MPEIEREEVLAQRLEELQRIQDKRNLDQMFKATKEGGGEDDSVSKAAKRTHLTPHLVEIHEDLPVGLYRRACRPWCDEGEEPKIG